MLFVKVILIARIFFNRNLNLSFTKTLNHDINIIHLFATFEERSSLDSYGCKPLWSLSRLHHAKG